MVKAGCSYMSNATGQMFHIISKLGVIYNVDVESLVYDDHGEPKAETATSREVWTQDKLDKMDLEFVWDNNDL